MMLGTYRLDASICRILKVLSAIQSLESESMGGNKMSARRQIISV